MANAKLTLTCNVQESPVSNTGDAEKDITFPFRANRDAPKPHSLMKRISSHTSILDATATAEAKLAMRRVRSSSGLPMAIQRANRNGTRTRTRRLDVNRTQSASDAPVATAPTQKPLPRSCTDPNLILLKGILKKPTKEASDTSLKKVVSWSDMNRWTSQGSGLNLQALVSTSTFSKLEAPAALSAKANHQWGRVNEDEANTEAKSMANLSGFHKGGRKFQAPGIPQRHISDEDLIPMKKRIGGTYRPNPFQAAVVDFQNATVRDTMSQDWNKIQAPPGKPMRRKSNEFKTATPKIEKVNPFKAAVVDFQTSVAKEMLNSSTSSKPTTATSSSSSSLVRDLLNMRQQNRESSSGHPTQTTVTSPVRPSRRVSMEHSAQEVAMVASH